MLDDLSIGMPSLIILRGAVASVWLYEGLWSKLLGGASRQVDVVQSVPKFGEKFGRPFLLLLGWVEVALAVWILSGNYPALCAIAQVGLLVCLNINGLLWARHLIHDPAGMVVKNAAFLVLVWVCGVMGKEAGR